MSTTTPPEVTPATQQANPLRAQYNSKRALLASIENSKHTISVIERQELDLQKQLEDARVEKRINLKLWEKHCGGRKDEGGK
ncbi:hypothetical protein FGG08_002731 [Glutinoglossum americanum]|uniref:Uncharacterized protein n=1 Tax=Glutinoglossum americanum TaxID=1670608 RepID=A0A9P8I456_9PEZI|nr:hypothetical protein FGG08_002731 [Glutinoglossum americanum]